MFAATLLMVAGWSCVQAQQPKQTSQGIEATVADMDVKVEFYAPGIVRVTKVPHGCQAPKHSYSVIKQPETTQVDIARRDGAVTLKTSKMTMRINLKNGRISYADAAGKALLAEQREGTQFTPVSYGGTNSYEVRQAFKLDRDECIYGLGQHQQGRMNQRNQHLILRQNNTEIAIPYLQSVKGYGLLWDNTSPTTFTDNPVEMAFTSQMASGADYYFLCGNTADEVQRLLRDLTGQVQMNALWTYGFFQSKERYQSQEELLGVVKKYRELRVPLDGIVQDWQYWGTDNNKWNAVKFDNPNFPNPKEMIDEVHRQHAHIIISVWPNFGNKTDINKELKDKNLLLDFKTYPEQAKVYDPFHPEARDIFWRHMNQGLFQLGIDGWWPDATEPEFSDNDRKMDQPTHDGLYRSVYNAFPITTVGGVYDHQRAVCQDKRVFILTRSAFAGQQRYGACSWSGDIMSTWEVLRKQIPAGLNFSISGIPYWNTDIGGFVTCNDYPEGYTDPAYQELYTRWIQFGAFTPMMRSHGTCTPREIYRFGQRGTWAFDAIEKFIRLRYRLLPYLYATAWRVHSDGDTFMRPLFMDFPTDTQACTLDDQYLFGRSFLVAPVTHAMYVGKDHKVDMSHTQAKEVYLPAGTSWYDFWTGQHTEGGKTVRRAAPIDIMPLYVKAGSIVPIGPDVQYAAEKDWSQLELRVYPGEDADFLLYEDDGDGYQYELGQHTLIPIHWDNAHRTLTIGDRQGAYRSMLKQRSFRIVTVGDKGKAKTVKYSGKAKRITSL